MRFKKRNIIRWFSFEKETVKLMKEKTKKDFIHYLKENAVCYGTHVDIINNKIVECKYYLLEERDNTSNKDFLVTYNGDLYYWNDYNNLIELID